MGLECPELSSYPLLADAKCYHHLCEELGVSTHKCVTEQYRFPNVGMSDPWRILELHLLSQRPRKLTVKWTDVYVFFMAT